MNEQEANLGEILRRATAAASTKRDSVQPPPVPKGNLEMRLKKAIGLSPLASEDELIAHVERMQAELARSYRVSRKHFELLQEIYSGS